MIGGVSQDVYYVFDDKDAEIRDLLLWEGRDILEISRFNFEITSLDKVRGKILVSTLKDHRQTSEDYIKFLKTSGFKSIKRNDSGYQKELYLTTTVQLRTLQTEQVNSFWLWLCVITFDEVAQILGSLKKREAKNLR